MVNCRRTITLLLLLSLVLFVAGSVFSGDSKEETATEWKQVRSAAAQKQADVDPAVQRKIEAQQKYEAELASQYKETTEEWPVDSRVGPDFLVPPGFTEKASTFLTEDFEGLVIPPAGWGTVITNGSFTWKLHTFAPFEGAGATDVEYDPALVPQDEWLISPSFDLSSATTDVRLSFWWNMSYYWGISPFNNYDIEVWISTDGGSTFPTKLWDEGTVGLFTNWVYYNAVISLSAYVGESDVVLGFRYVGVDGAQAVLDLIEVTDDPPPTGRCCSGSPSEPDCADMTQAECDALGGDWDETLSCATDPCPVTGPGDNCAEPLTVAIPQDLPFSDNNFTCNRIDDYDATCGGSYDGGEDIIYELTVYLSPVTVDITLDPLGTTWTGIVVDGSCPPDPSTCIATQNNGSSSTPYSIQNLTLSPGTYYIMIDTWPSPDCIPSFNLTIDESDPSQPGDNCDNPLKIDIPTLPYSDIGQTTCGRINNYNATCLGSYDGGEDVIYEVTVISEVTVDIELDPLGTSYTGIILDDVCPPDNVEPLGISTSSGTNPHGMSAVTLPPGVYYLMIDTWPSPNCIPTFDLNITESTPLTPPDNDDWANAEEIGNVVDLPFNTGGATSDGPLGCQDCPNIWYCYTADCDGRVTVSLCGSSYDTKLTIYNGCGEPTLSNELECNDDACGLQSEVEFIATNGSTYLIEIGGYHSTSPCDCKTGEGVLNVTCELPCQVECPSGATDEAEPCGSDTNGGCNSAPPIFTDITCGETVCGTAWADGGFRDTDWYRLTLDGFYEVTWTVQAEFDALIGPVGSNNPGSGDCADATGFIDPAGFPLECEVGSVTTVFGPGVYLLFVAPAAFEGYPCGSNAWDYVATVTCVPATPEYCDAGSDVCDEYIENVVVGSINNSSACEGYADFTALSTTMAIGISYPMTMTIGNAYSLDAGAVYVDWNQDFDFTDPGERFDPAGSPGYGPYTVDIIPPPGALPGPTRMRCRLTWNTDPGPCGFHTYGEVEDYTVVVEGGVSEIMVLDPEPISAVMGRPLEPQCVHVYLGGEFAPGYDVNDIITSSLLINGLPAVQTEILSSYPDFIGDVLHICVDMQSFVRGFGILYNTTTQNCNVSGEMGDAMPFSVDGDLTYIGHIAGDVNLDGSVNVLDLNFLVNRVFRGGPAPEDPIEGDVNADGMVANIIDLNYMVNFVFRGGPPPLKLEQ